MDSTVVESIENIFGTFGKFCNDKMKKKWFFEF